MLKLKLILSVIAISLIGIGNINAQKRSTYKLGGTTYIIGEVYSSTFQPKVQRSKKVKNDFLKSQGFDIQPKGYEVDHIRPLSQGGVDETWNMQLLSKEQHRLKTKFERSNGFHHRRK